MSQIDYNLLQSIIDIQSNLFKISNNNSSSFYPTIDNLKKLLTKKISTSMAKKSILF